MKLDDTIVMEDIQEELMTPFENEELLDNRANKRMKIAQILSLVVMTLAGTLTGVFSAFVMAVSDAKDINEVPVDMRAEADQHWEWLAEFTSKTAQADYKTTHTVMIIISVIVFLAGLIAYSISNAKIAETDDGTYKLNWLDRIWSEVQIAVIIFVSGMAIASAGPIVDLVRYSNWVSIMKPYNVVKYAYGIKNEVVLALCIIGMAACIAIAGICFGSLVRKLAAKSLIKHSLLGKILELLGIGAKHNFAESNRRLWVPSEEDRHAVTKLTLKYIAIAVVLISAPFLRLRHEYGWFPLGAVILWILSIILASVLIIRKVRKFAEIRAGVIEVKSGNLAYKINVVEDANGPKTDLDKLASNINHISEATNIAVQNEIKNQRMKTDLISNVSHDLKTPLTSMISYLDILEKEGLDSPDAPAHLAVVQEKTARLKTLTEELFEAAKASSGNIACEITIIDLNALIDQSLAEMGDRLAMKNLQIRKNIKADNTMIKADGKLMYRILENLLGNISKYALEDSRVYIDVSKPEEYNDKLLLEVKNISKDELNISEDELMERFTRGDSSRNTEGSGLGLAIAKDLAKIMGGEFSISIDGDMFKASVLLNEA